MITSFIYSVMTEIPRRWREESQCQLRFTVWVHGQNVFPWTPLYGEKNWTEQTFSGIPVLHQLRLGFGWHRLVRLFHHRAWEILTDGESSRLFWEYSNVLAQLARELKIALIKWPQRFLPWASSVRLMQTLWRGNPAKSCLSNSPICAKRLAIRWLGLPGSFNSFFPYVMSEVNRWCTWY